MYLGDIRDHTRPSENKEMDSPMEMSPVGMVNTRFENLNERFSDLKTEMNSGLKDLAVQRDSIVETIDMHRKSIAMLQAELQINESRNEALKYMYSIVDPIVVHTDPHMYGPSEMDSEGPRQDFGTMPGMPHPSNRY